MDVSELFSKIRGSELGERINEMHTLYDELDRAQNRFCESFDIHCKPGCGCCCEHFVPDLTRSEAEYLAFGLTAEERQQEVLEMIRTWNPENPTCPMFRADNPFHCSVYRWRPLVCRLFGASAVRDKEGRPQFRHCKWNKVADELTAEQMESKMNDVVLMDEYGLRLEEISVSDNQTELLPKVLGNSMFELDMILRYSQTQDGDCSSDVPPESSPSAS